MDNMSTDDVEHRAGPRVLKPVTESQIAETKRAFEEEAQSFTIPVEKSDGEPFYDPSVLEQPSDEAASSSSAWASTRWTSAFTGIISPDSEMYPSDAGRYHLYSHQGCPWSHRCMLVRSIKGLEDVVGMSLFEPEMKKEKSSAAATPIETFYFASSSYRMRDPEPQCTTARELYLLSDPLYEVKMEEARSRGQQLSAFTVPFIWDRVTGKIVNNDIGQCMQILSRSFEGLGSAQHVDLCPLSSLNRVDKLSERLYHLVNNGVYKVGFAQKRSDMRTARKALFAELKRLDLQLSSRRYLCGTQITEADVCLFVTLMRFDLIYYSRFNCDICKIKDFKHLHAYTRDLFSQWRAYDTFSFKHVVGLYSGKGRSSRWTDEDENNMFTEFLQDCSERKKIVIPEHSAWSWASLQRRLSLENVMGLVLVCHALFTLMITWFDISTVQSGDSEAILRLLRKPSNHN